MSRKGKIFLVLTALLLVVSAFLGGCSSSKQPASSSNSSGKQLAIGIVLPTKDEPRWIQDETRFQDALKDTPYAAEILFSQGDPAKEKANVETLLSKGIKVLILCPHDANAAAASAEAAKKAGVKVISYDRLILNTDAVDYYVTFDSVQVGQQQGQYLVDHATGKGNPLYLYAGALSDNNSFLFFQGAWEVLQPKIADGTFVIANSDKANALKDKKDLTRQEMADIIGQITTNWDFNTAKNLAQANLAKAPKDLKGNVFILAPNDGTARSIADTFAADPDIKSYVITGQDAEKPSIQYIIDGKQSMTVFKDVRILVKDAINVALTYLKGGTPESTKTYNNGVKDVPSKPSPVQVVDKNNVKQVLIDSGYYKESDFKWPK
ncbi:MAG: Periplasmic sugar-binding protein [Caldanaerobacter subterraneus]|uniref:Sugar ABC transporter substrate-binding protein n=3 Tax=Caldanaerobacter subterraneus TaxID=911092 RepID=U5CRF4_CALSX|nr:MULTISPECIES: sugar-binding protein [Caldanaerobacter]ERM92548.1 sugar ABC transporter substrate-binding protein [Caldanaerobacter subterraneus subsp. yonseiensis KB-1]KKC30709.1 periplasmic sugar-binding protein [Caldanaerobacter subterraneus subsp. pacificus DSM 12653]KUK09529.1 MAG: Periplasmic sugar-binding protein [Caldanaerobacter subterraneus]MDI3518198.1 putative multiple sugar transport system substrate-binding protein [Caldanaerobacter sp.]HBT49050.1 sugar ABC transporter substrat